MLPWQSFSRNRFSLFDAKLHYTASLFPFLLFTLTLNVIISPPFLPLRSPPAASHTRPVSCWTNEPPFYGFVKYYNTAFPLSPAACWSRGLHFARFPNGRRSRWVTCGPAGAGCVVIISLILIIVGEPALS